MPAPLVPIAAIAGFALVAVLVSLLNDRRPVDIGALFPVDGRNDWPRGVQEPDVPRFAVDHADRLRPSVDPTADVGTASAASCRPERLVPRVHRFAPDHRR